MVLKVQETNIDISKFMILGCNLKFNFGEIIYYCSCLNGINLVFRLNIKICAPVNLFFQIFARNCIY